MESDTEDDSYFDVFFPSFIMVLRDINVKLTDTANKPITPNQYLENALVLKRGKSDSVRAYNIPRELIRKYFKHRRCFKFSTPRHPRELDRGVSPKDFAFESDVKAFTQYIYQCKPKRMTSGRQLNGRMLGSLVRSYVRFIQDGNPPCMHTAAKEMIEYENQNLVIAAQDVYKTEMQRLCGDAIPETEAMAKFHVQSADKAIQYLRKVIIYDNVELFTRTAMESFEQILDKLIKSITKDSEMVCWGRLQSLDQQRVQRKFRHNAYQHISGYDEYIKDIEWIIKQYKQTVGLGPKKTQVLQSYLDGKEEEESKVFHMVQQAQKEEAAVQEPKPEVEVLKRSYLRQLSKEADSKSSLEIIKDVKRDQSEQRKELRENLQNIGNEKIKEYERQVHEGFESAPVTEQENKRFVEIFLSTEESEPDGPPDTLDKKDKLAEYDPPWDMHPDVAIETRYSKGAQPGAPSDPWKNWQEDPTYYDFVDIQSGRPQQPLQSTRKPKPCIIL